MNQPLGPGNGSPSTPPNGGGIGIPARKRGGEGGGIGATLKNLPLPAKVILGVVVFGLIYLLLGNHHAANGPGNAPTTTNAQALQGGSLGPSGTAVFNGLDSDRPVLMQNWMEQNRRDMAGLKDQVEQQFSKRDQALSDALQQNGEMQRQMQQMMSDFTNEIHGMQATADHDRETMSQLADEQKKMQLNAPVDGTGSVAPDSSGVVLPHKQDRINQTPLGAPAGGAGLAGRPISQANQQLLPPGDAPAPLPFVPPLGFIKATMLNGVDALVGGQPTPALVRLQGVYKTAMNTTVKLDGCYALVEFQGEVSTERAVGKPSRMTCVYPDSGTTTYSLSGYVVDAEDGIIGVPGVFYEGDASRIAAAMLADFAAGLSQAVEQNNTATSTDLSTGTTVSTVTGSQLRTAAAGGVNKATSSLRDYLMDRVNRVLPFVRLDATREIHLVLLSGVELRHEGSPWTQLFDAETADSARANAPTLAEPADKNAQGQVATPANTSQPALLPPSQTSAAQSPAQGG